MHSTSTNHLLKKTNSSLLTSGSKLPIIHTKEVCVQRFVPNSSKTAKNCSDLRDNQIQLKTAPKKNEDVDFIQKIRSVACFLCEKEFDSDDAMTNHYFTVHKHNSNSKPGVIVTTNQTSLMTSKSTSVLTTTTSSVNNVPGTIVPSAPTQPVSTNYTESAKTKPLENSESKCSLCHILFRSPSAVEKHMKEVHSYKCSYCNQTFYSLFGSANHVCENRLKSSENTASVNRISFSVPASSFPQGSQPNLVPVNSSIMKIFTARDGTLQGFIPSQVHSTGQPFLLLQSSLYQPKEVNQKSIRRPLSDYTAAELRSPAVIKDNLEEMRKNPQISLEPLPKIEKCPEDFTCSRCHILCENLEDFSLHLKECLYLSNVSMSPSETDQKMSLNISYFRSISNDPPFEINKTLMDRIEMYKKCGLDKSVINFSSNVNTASKCKNNKKEVTIKKIRRRNRRCPWNEPEQQKVIFDETPHSSTSSEQVTCSKVFITPVNSNVYSISPNPTVGASSKTNKETAVATTLKANVEPVMSASIKPHKEQAVSILLKSNSEAAPVSQKITRPLPSVLEDSEEEIEDPLLIPKTEAPEIVGDIEQESEDDAYELLTEDDVKMEIEDEILWDT